MDRILEMIVATILAPPVIRASIAHPDHLGQEASQDLGVVLDPPDLLDLPENRVLLDLPDLPESRDLLDLPDLPESKDLLDLPESKDLLDLPEEY